MAIHALTGILFALSSGIIVWIVLGERLWRLALVAPVTLAAAWGWWLQTRFFLAALRKRDLDLR